MRIGKIVAVLLCLLYVQGFGRTTYTVGPGGPPTYDYDSIQDAIDACASSGDIITVANGTYYENIDYSTKDINIVSLGGASNCTICGDGSTSSPKPVVYFWGNETNDAILDGFTITNGTGDWYSGGT